MYLHNNIMKLHCTLVLCSKHIIIMIIQYCVLGYYINLCRYTVSEGENLNVRTTVNNLNFYKLLLSVMSLIASIYRHWTVLLVMYRPIISQY